MEQKETSCLNKSKVLTGIMIKLAIKHPQYNKTEQNYSHHSSIGFSSHYKAKWIRLVFSDVQGTLCTGFPLRNATWETNFIPLR